MRASRIRALLPIHEMIPLDPPILWICGLIAVGGRDCPVIDLAGKLELAHGSHGRQPCVVVVEGITSEGAREFGFVADRISEILKLRERDFRTDQAHIDPARIDFARVSDHLRRVFDPETVAQDENLWSMWRSVLLIHGCHPHQTI